jgi:hypothetical protein
MVSPKSYSPSPPPAAAIASLINETRRGVLLRRINEYGWIEMNSVGNQSQVTSSFINPQSIGPGAR